VIDDQVNMLSLPEAAEALGVDPGYLRWLAENGVIPGAIVHGGDHVRVPQDASIPQRYRYTRREFLSKLKG